MAVTGSTWQLWGLCGKILNCFEILAPPSSKCHVEPVITRDVNIDLIPLTKLPLIHGSYEDVIMAFM